MNDSKKVIPLLEVRNVSKYFCSVIALRDISMQVNGGEGTCVLGDNGAGKSTLIKILSGGHPHDDGELLVERHSGHFGGPREPRAAGLSGAFPDPGPRPLSSRWSTFCLG